jgi:hypothetical protein
VEPWYTRRKGEVSHADRVPVADAILMPLQSIEGTPKQARIDPTVYTVRSSESKLSSCRPRSKGRERKIDKKTA